MRKSVLGLVVLVALAATVAVRESRHPPPPRPALAVAIVAPTPAKVPAPAPPPKASDLPTIAVAAREIHIVPENGPPPEEVPFTLRTRDGRVIATTGDAPGRHGRPARHESPPLRP